MLKAIQTCSVLRGKVLTVKSRRESNRQPEAEDAGNLPPVKAPVDVRKEVTKWLPLRLGFLDSGPARETAVPEDDIQLLSQNANPDGKVIERRVAPLEVPGAV